jgi:hypothetical protein
MIQFTVTNTARSMTARIIWLIPIWPNPSLWLAHGVMALRQKLTGVLVSLLLIVVICITSLLLTTVSVYQKENPMANPLENVIALAKKGDRRVLLVGAGAVGGGVGLVVYLKNRGKGGQSQFSGSPSGGGFGGSGGGDGSGGSGGGGSGGGSSSSLGDLGLPGFQLPEVPAVDLPTLETPAAPDLPTLTGLESSFQLPNFAGSSPLSLPEFPTLPGLGDLGGGFNLPSLSSFPSLPELGPLSYAGGSYGNALGTLPELPEQSLAVQNLRAGATSVPESAPSDPFAAITAAARAAAQNQTPLQAFASGVQDVAQRATQAIQQGTMQPVQLVPQSAAQTQASLQAVSSAQSAFGGLGENIIKLFQQKQSENVQATLAAQSAATQVQATAQRAVQAIQQGTMEQVQYNPVSAELQRIIAASQASFARQAEALAQANAIRAQQAQQQQQAQEYVRQQAQSYADAVRGAAERAQQAIRAGTQQQVDYYMSPQVTQAAQQAIRTVGGAVSGLGTSRTGSLSGIAAAIQRQQEEQRNANTSQTRRGQAF